MKENSLSLPGQRNYIYALNEAYVLACEKLAKADVREVCRESGADYAETAQVINLKYLGETYHISLPAIDISAESKEPLPLREKILLLHYLTCAKGLPLASRLITFKELSEGMSYHPTFAKRAIKPLIDTFAREPARLIQAAIRFGGYKADYGDASATINAFPRVPVTLVLWEGDTELSPEGNILFDSTIANYLPTEDIIVLSETITWKLVRSLRQK